MKLLSRIRGEKRIRTPTDDWSCSSFSRREYVLYAIVSSIYAFKNWLSRLFLRRPLRICIAAIVKNEEHDLLEWVAYHRVIGVDSFLIYDNDSNDGTIDLLKNFEKLGFVRVIRWPRKEGITPQITFMKDSFWRILNFDWVLYLDADEFLVLHKHETVQEFFAAVRNSSAVIFNWRLFGSSGHIKQDSRPLIEKFTLCSPRDYYAQFHFKTAIRPWKSRCRARDPHTIFTRGRTVYPDGTQATEADLNIGERLEKRQGHISFSTAQLNHYHVKSKEEFVRKVLRGRADQSNRRVFDDAGIEALFAKRDLNTERDTSIQRHLVATKTMMAEVLSALSRPVENSAKKAERKIA